MTKKQFSGNKYNKNSVIILNTGIKLFRIFFCIDWYTSLAWNQFGINFNDIFRGNFDHFFIILTTFSSQKISNFKAFIS